MAESKLELVRFGQWWVEPGLNRLHREDREKILEPRTMAVLEYLLERHAEVVSVDDLLEHVWNGQLIEQNSVQRHIARLRRALGDDSRSPHYIETIKKRGYRAIGPLERWAGRQPTLPQAAPRVSIAVLPLDNLSPDAVNAFFAAGIHEELLTRLARIQSLKVISRTSVLEYLGSPKNIRTIAEELGVSKIVEGTVRRAIDTVRINIQLIDALNDQHLWAESYERGFSAESIFAIQGEIATSIVAAVRTTLSPQEEEDLTHVPTASTRAYDFYLIGNTYFSAFDNPETLPLALQMYEKAIAADPGFALGHAALSQAHGRMYWTGRDRTANRLKWAFESLQTAMDLAPGLPEAHLAAGQYHYRGLDDYRRALDEYAIAEKGMPGNAQLAMARAEAHRRLGEWQASLRYWEQAMELDPRNPQPVFQTYFTLALIRDYERAEYYFRRAMELRPDETFWGNMVPLYRDGDPSTLRHAIQPLIWLKVVWERDSTKAMAFLDELPEQDFSSMIAFVPKESMRAMVWQRAGAELEARRCYAATRLQVEQALKSNDRDPLLYIALGEALAGLGKGDAAVRAAERALELRPVTSDAFTGPSVLLDAAMRVFLAAGAYDRAFEALDTYLAGPGTWSIEGLLHDPRLDPVRDDPRLAALLRRWARSSAARDT